MKKSDLATSEFNEYYGRYINKLSNDIELLDSYTNGKQHVLTFFNAIPKDKQNYKYQPEKWSIKEVLQHLIDTERIFMYRCLRIARNDKTPLAGFDQNTYIEPSGASHKSFEELLDEFRINRDNSIVLLKSLSDQNLTSLGNASGFDLSARAAAFIIPGHDVWHMKVIEKKYL